jgi:hypothetical protein
MTMTDHVDRIPPVQLTLEDSLRITVEGAPRWAPVLGLVRTGDIVVVTCAGLDTALALAASVPVVVLRTDQSAFGADGEVYEAMSDWYAGDVAQAGEAVTEHARVGARTGAGGDPESAAPAAGSRRSTFERDPSLVGIYGGDLDHIVDAMGAGTTDQDARSRRAAHERSLAEAAAARADHAPQPGEPETDEITEAVEARMAGWYAGDVDFVREHKDEH